MELGKSKSQYQKTTITLEAARHVYTTEFIALIKDFYLKY
jgi:tRNA1Val (adenine37-N6)-methyltransferase